MRPLSYPQTDVFLICYSIVDETSLENVKHKWSDEIKYHADGVPIILVGTKLDLRFDSDYVSKMEAQGKRLLTKEQGQEVANQIGAKLHLECSALTQQGLKEVFDKSNSGSVKASGQRKEEEEKERLCHLVNATEWALTFVVGNASPRLRLGTMFGRLVRA